MSAFLLASAAAGGYCGTLYPGWWRHPHPPDPEPWWIRVLGLAVGLIVGYVATRVSPAETGFTLPDVAATTFVAFAFGAMAANLAGFGRGKAAGS